MTLREWTSSQGMRIALGALVLGMITTGWAYSRAKSVVPVPPAAVSGSIVAGALDGPPAPADVNVIAAVSSDIFSPERKAPAKRYRLPGEAIPAAPVEPSKPTLLGTGVRLDGSPFATATFESSRLLFLSVGDIVGVYHVKSIERGKVVLVTAAGKELEILAPRTGS